MDGRRSRRRQKLRMRDTEVAEVVEKDAMERMLNGREGSEQAVPTGNKWSKEDDDS